MPTSFTTTRVPQLLQPTTDLLGCPPLSGLVEDVIRDKSIPHRKAAEEPGLPGVIGLVAFET
jgi:hypothetical protein